LVQVGRTGVLTPVAVLEPVELGGTTVSRATLHNEGMIASLDVRLGDRVSIQKAGEIIPQIMSVDPSFRTEGRHAESAPFVMPDKCPDCGTPVVRNEEEAALRCPNRLCPAQVRGSIFYFTRRFAMDIDHLGIALVEQLTAAGLVRDVADLYKLTEEQLLSLERIGEKSAKNVLQSIDTSRARTLDRLICGLGIPQIGQVAARQIAEEAVTLETLTTWTEEEARARIGGVRGFGPKMVDSVVQWLADPIHHALLDKLLALEVGAPQPVHAQVTEGPLLGKSFCVTGVLSRKREDVHTDLRARGARVDDGVKKDTTYLVAGEKTGKSKLDQAKKFGTRVVDEAQLEILLSGGELPALPEPEAAAAKAPKEAKEKKPRAKKAAAAPTKAEEPGDESA
jgi:DNA ligase (NAD+)